MKTPPFFVMGCVRSGTTYLRDVLRRHPNLASPEETHFYRWSDPFGTTGYNRVLLNNNTLIRHRELDGISEETFSGILEKSTSRRSLYFNYMECYINRNKPAARRWFDKTPQNVYGAALLASEFPGSKIIHIVRNPLDVVSSLKVGKVIHVPEIVGACNYWLESIRIMDVIAKAYPHRVCEIRYEDLTANLGVELPRLLEFIDEDHDAQYFSDVVSRPKKHAHAEVLTEEDLSSIDRLCGPFAERYGYFSQGSD